MKVDVAAMQDLALAQCCEWIVVASMNDNLAVPSFNFTVRGIFGDPDLGPLDVVGALDFFCKSLSRSTVA